MAETCGVQVGVRIRPFNQREKDLNAVLCVEMDGPMTTLNDLESKEKKEPKKFTFDYSFWSHDGFENDANGYSCAMPGSNYADQKHVFDALGKQVLDNAWAGYHCCLFAYGQTGAGKSYSMVGYGANRGIVPISCEEIFTRIEGNQDPGLKYEVLISMVEIYNEQVQDLLVSPQNRPKKGLEIRESKQLGIYIDGVGKRAVASYKAIEAVVDEGTTNRTVGSTLMNATSSRAHTVLVIEFKQLSEAAGQTGCKVSLINLVDLAGSEKAGQTGAQGDRLKEGCAINKSLSALGNVIEKLADKATGKAKATAVIPYRDSKLTRLLQNALGGSSKTVMICAISPASSNYEETLSTLRYADRAKRIKNAAVVNENPADKLIRQLREENAKLRDMIGNQSPNDAGGSEEEMLQKKAEIASLENALTEMQKSFQDRLAEAREQAAAEAAAKQKKEVDLTMPHIANLNEDQLLTNKLRFAFKAGVQTRIGRAAAGAEEDTEHGAPEVCLAGPGIQRDHAVASNDNGTCALACHSQEAAEATCVNGQRPTAGGPAVALKHGDRLAFGQCLFVFIDPAVGTAEELLSSGQVSYQAARKEALDGGPDKEELEELKASRERQAELERLVREAEDTKAKAQQEAEMRLREREEEFKQRMESLQQDWNQKLREKAAEVEAQASEQASAEEQALSHQKELDRLQQEFEERQRKAEEAAQQQIKELENKAKKAAAEEEDHRQKEENRRKLEEQLMIAMPLVKEANLIAAELKRPIRLETKMQVSLSSDHTRGSVLVSAAVFQDDVRVYDWALETLENRVFLMRELLQRCEEEGGIESAQNLTKYEDPFWDPIEPERQIGVAQLSLQGLLAQMENIHDCKILSTETLAATGSRQEKKPTAPHEVGRLRVELWPCARDGSPGVPDEEVVDDPSELLGSTMTILVHVVGAKGLSPVLANDVRVEFDFFMNEKSVTVPTLHGACTDPEIHFKHVIVQDPVTSRFLEYCERKTMVFRVYGSDAAAMQLKEAAAAAAAAAPPMDETPLHGGSSLEASPASMELPGTVREQTPAASPTSGLMTPAQARRDVEAARGSPQATSDARKSKSCAIL